MTMIYIISDIHGCYDEYLELLKKIQFNDEDELFVLGDVVDRGPQPVKVLKDMLEYLEEFSLYEELFVGEKRYILVHAGLNGFKDENTFLVTGHTPTFGIRKDGKQLVYEENGHLAIDCGCVYGGKLAAYCLDTGEIFYVDENVEK